MSFQRIQSGQLGEDAAARFLCKNGYKILERNFKNTLGEIDIIAQDSGVLCFIEVKTRTSDLFGSPFESVTPAKQRKLTRVAQSYLKLRRIPDKKMRFDVIAVMKRGGHYDQVDIIKDAFEAQ
jgi:putative endonuclease